MWRLILVGMAILASVLFTVPDVEADHGLGKSTPTPVVTPTRIPVDPLPCHRVPFYPTDRCHQQHGQR